MYNRNTLRTIRCKEDENDEDLGNDGTGICSWNKPGCLHHKVMEKGTFVKKSLNTRQLLCDIWHVTNIIILTELCTLFQKPNCLLSI